MDAHSLLSVTCRTGRAGELNASRLFRAIETARRRDRIIDDPDAAAFLTGRYARLARLARVPPVGRRSERYLNRRFPGGPRASAVVRTRLIDELVSDALAEAGQLVLLGAGYDSRAYRLPAAQGATVFEVDHPAHRRPSAASSTRETSGRRALPSPGSVAGNPFSARSLS
jgi:methyltransferase (TIGR00027 family)